MNTKFYIKDITDNPCEYGIQRLKELGYNLEGELDLLELIPHIENELDADQIYWLVDRVLQDDDDCIYLYLDNKYPGIDFMELTDEEIYYRLGNEEFIKAMTGFVSDYLSSLDS